MKQLYACAKDGYSIILCILAIVFLLNSSSVSGQTCPLNTTSLLSSFPNTYYPANQTTVNSGSQSISLGTVTYGSTPISAGDIILIIQMQGSQINSTNTSSYGDGSGIGGGYLNNGNMLAGNMEYAVASNSVPLTGGTLNTVSGLVHSYQSTPFGADGQYSYQIIRVPVYYNVTLTATITAPRWNGVAGGVIVLYATDSLSFNSQTINASALGFRGGGGRAFTGSGSGTSADFITPASSNANGGKGEGISGTPKYLNDNNAFLDVSAFEGYPNGSYGKGAPGNAGGGGTDGDPASNNDQNTGGGGGANGAAGGFGGWAWSSAIPSGGRPGSIFSQAAPSRLVMGGGGGAGTTNNATGTPGNGFASSGSAGGGIIILTANVISGTGSIKANGSPANSTVLNDGAGGAGAGGSILIFSNSGSLTHITASANGGNGGNNQVSGGASHGPGGGGGGGVIYYSSALNAASSVNGGLAGTTSGLSTNYGATAGTAGILQSVTQSQTPVFPLQCVVLASSFLHVEAQQGNGLVNVQWEATQDVNTKEYSVEKSLDGINFSSIAIVSAKPSVTYGNQYEYPDENAFASGSLIYYRIREVSASGESIYSVIVSLRVSGLSSKLSVYPNPARTSATVSFVSAAPCSVTLRLFDMKGSVVWQRNYQANQGQNMVQIDGIQALANGVYILQWFDGLKPVQVKLEVNH
jgi:hypothetical protein